NDLRRIDAVELPASENLRDDLERIADLHLLRAGANAELKLADCAGKSLRLAFGRQRPDINLDRLARDSESLRRPESEHPEWVGNVVAKRLDELPPVHRDLRPRAERERAKREPAGLC